MLPRKWTTHILPIFLSALLAWPSCVPILTTDLTTSVKVEGKPREARAGAGFHHRDRRSWLDQANWSDLADDYESSDDRDDFRPIDLGLPRFGLDLPSLIPVTIEFVLIRPIGKSSAFLSLPHLLC